MKITKISAALGVATALGVAALPLATYAETDTTTVSVTISETFTVSATSTVSTTVTNNTAVNESMQPAVTVITNHATGWTLSAKTTHTGGPALKSGSNSIGAAVPSTGTSAWAIKGGSKTSYTALSATDTLMASSSTPTSGTGVITTFTIGVTASSSQAAGSYTGTITWTGAIH